MSFSSPETAHAPGCHSWRGGGGGSLPGTSQLLDLSRSPNCEKNIGSSQTTKEKEQWLLSSPPQPLAACRGCSRSCAGATLAPAGSAVCGVRASWGRNPGWQLGGDVGRIKGPQAPLPAPLGSTRRGRGSAAREASQESEQMVGGCVPLPLAGRLKIVTGRKRSGGDGSICPATGGAWLKVVSRSWLS